MSIYLDYNASTPIDADVLETMVSVYKYSYGNADSRTHDFGDHARSVVENARQQVASLLKVRKDEVFFTSGATESDNIAILGLQEYALKANKKHIISTAIEHKAVLEPLRHLEKSGFEVTYIYPDSTGRINYQRVLKEIRDDTLLVSVMHANNESGIIQPVKEIGDYLEGKDILFHIDAAQTFGKLVEEIQCLKYDILSASSHKMYGPQGIGTIVLRRKKYRLPPVKAIQFGGSQEHNLRPGTVPTALIAGFGKACELSRNNYKTYTENYLTTKESICSALNNSSVNYQINGDQEYCMPNTINVSFDGVNSEAAMLYGKEYCAVSNGSACNSNSYKPSHVLTAMGYDIDRVKSSIRISWGHNPIDIESNFLSFLDIIKTFQ